MATLRLGEIDRSLNIVEPKLFVCTPNKKTIGRLSEASNVQLDTRISDLNTLTFSIPLKVEKDLVVVDNPNVKLIKNDFRIRLVLGGVTEYFIVTDIDRVSNDSGEFATYQTFSLGYELNNTTIRRYDATSKNMSHMLKEILSHTNWSVGYVDSDFDLRYRSIDIASQTTLEVINLLSEKFSSLVIWDTVNKRVNMYKSENIGVNKGLRVTDEKYLMSLNEAQDSENIVTRLRLYGKDGLSIRSLSSTGSEYIEDYSYFMYPFERDEHRNVISHSAYHMSDDLCHAILDYEELIESEKGSFGILLAKQEIVQKELQKSEDKLVALVTELMIIMDKLDIENSRGVPDKELHAQIVSDRIKKETEIDREESTLLMIEDELLDIQRDISTLQNRLLSQNNFTKDQMSELQNYVREKEYSNDFIIDPEDLLNEGRRAFNDMREPALDVQIDIVNLLEIIDCQHDWDKLVLGDIITVRHERLGVHIRAKIVEINYDFDNSTIKVTLANAQRYSTDKAFEDIITKAHTTSTRVDMDKYDWDLSVENNGAINDIINNMWDATKRAIEAGAEQLISISERGIIVKSPEDPLTYLVIQNGMLAITNDGGNTWKHAITSEGIVGERIYGKIIMGVNLAIEDIDGIIKFRGSKGQIFDRNGEEVMRLGLVSEPPEPDCFGLVSWNSINRVAITDCEGVSISRKTPTDKWEKVLWAHPTNGTLYTRDLVAERLKIVNNMGDEILNAELGEFDLGWFEKITADGKLTTVEKYEVWSRVNQIMSDYRHLIDHAQNFTHSGRDNTYNFDAQDVQSTRVSSDAHRVSTARLTSRYNALISYIGNFISIPPAFNKTLMDRTDTIGRNEFLGYFRRYYEEADSVREAIENFLFYSGLQTGTFYNNIIMDARTGFMAIRNDNKYRARLSATDGLALERWEGQWVKKLYASIGDPNYRDGTLIAEDMIAKSLKIVDGELGEKIILDQNDGITINGNNGEQIRLNANEGIAIDVEGDRRFWVGKDGLLYARKLIITPDKEEDLVNLPDGSFVSDLTVNSLRSLNKTNMQNYIYIKDNYLKILTGRGEVVDQQKFLLTMNDVDEDNWGYPYTEWGAGNQDGHQKGYLYKDSNTFTFAHESRSWIRSYIQLSGGEGRDVISMVGEGGTTRIKSNSQIILEVGSNSIVINNNGVKINGTRIDLN